MCVSKLNTIQREMQDFFFFSLSFFSFPFLHFSGFFFFFFNLFLMFGTFFSSLHYIRITSSFPHFPFDFLIPLFFPHLSFSRVPHTHLLFPHSLFFILTASFVPKVLFLFIFVSVFIFSSSSHCYSILIPSLPHISRHLNCIFMSPSS